MYGYDIETIAQTSQWKRPEEPRPIRVHQVQSNVKVLLTVSFNCNGVAPRKLYEYAPTERSNSPETHRIVEKLITSSHIDACA